MANVGSEEILQAEFRDRNGVLSDPTSVEGWMKDPQGDVFVLTFAATSDVGIWEATYTPVIDGDHWWRVESLGTGVRVAEEKKLPVSPQRVIH